jgi:hypothetical protein
MPKTGWRNGFLLFRRLTPFDLTGPHEVFARMPGSGNSLWLIRKNRITSMGLCQGEEGGDSLV